MSEKKLVKITPVDNTITLNGRLSIEGSAADGIPGDAYFDGDVGIGNDNPQAKLDVSGDARFDGDIHEGGIRLEDKYLRRDANTTELQLYRDTLEQTKTIMNKEVLKNLEQEIRLDYLEKRVNQSSDRMVELFINEKQTDWEGAADRAEIVENNDLYEDIKFDPERGMFKPGFMRIGKQHFMMETMEEFNLEGVGQQYKGAISRFDPKHNCYWLISTEGQGTAVIGEITKLDANMAKGKVRVLGRWYLDPLNVNYSFWCGIDVTPEQDQDTYLFVTSSSRSTTAGMRLGKIAVNDDGTLGENHVSAGGTLIWENTNPDFTAKYDFDGLTTHHYTDVTVWDSDNIALIELERAAPYSKSLVFYKRDTGSDGTFVKSETLSDITGLNKYLGTHASSHTGSYCICKDGNDLWIKVNEHYAAHRYIYRMDISSVTIESTTKYGGDITGLVGTFECTGTYSTSSTEITGVAATDEQWNSMKIGQKISGPSIESTIVNFNKTANTITIANTPVDDGSGLTLLVSGFPEVITISDRFDPKREYSVDGSYIAKEGITISSDGNLLELTSTAGQGRFIAKRALSDARWDSTEYIKTENQVAGEYAMTTDDHPAETSVPLRPNACMVTDDGSYWTGEIAQSVNTCKIYRYSPDGSVGSVRVVCHGDADPVLNANNIWDLTTDGTSVWLLVSNSSTCRIYKGPLTALESALNSVDRIIEIGGDTWVEQHNHLTVTKLRHGIAYDKDENCLYLLNDTDNCIDRLEAEGANVTATDKNSMYTENHIQLTIPKNSTWQGIACKDEKIYIVDEYNGAKPDYITVIDRDKSNTEKAYVVHRYQDPSIAFVTEGIKGIDFHGNDLVCVNEAQKRFYKMKTLEDPNVLQLHTFLEEENILLSNEIFSSTPIAERYFDPEEYADPRDIPDKKYMAIGYGYNGAKPTYTSGFTLLHLDTFLSDGVSTDSGKWNPRYDVRKIRYQHYESGYENSNGNVIGCHTNGVTVKRVTSLAIEKDMIIAAEAYANENDHGALKVICLKEGKAHMIGYNNIATVQTSGQIYNGSLSDRNDAKGWIGENNLELGLYSGRNAIYSLSVRTFTKEDESDYSEEYPSTFVLMGRTNSLDLLRIDWDNNRDRNPARVWQNLFNATYYGTYGSWIAPSGSLFAGYWVPAGQIMSYDLPVWEIDCDRNNLFAAGLGYTKHIASVGGYVETISQNSSCWKTASGEWRHILVCGTSTNGDNPVAGDTTISIIDCENKSVKHAISYIHHTDAFRGVDSFEDSIFCMNMDRGNSGSLNGLFILKKGYFDSKECINYQRNYAYYSSIWNSDHDIKGISRPYYNISCRWINGDGLYPSVNYNPYEDMLSVGNGIRGIQLYHFLRKESGNHSTIDMECSSPSSCYYTQKTLLPESERVLIVDENDPLESTSISFTDGVSNFWSIENGVHKIQYENSSQAHCLWSDVTGLIRGGINFVKDNTAGSAKITVTDVTVPATPETIIDGEIIDLHFNAVGTANESEKTEEYVYWIELEADRVYSIRIENSGTGFLKIRGFQKVVTLRNGSVQTELILWNREDSTFIGDEETRCLYGPFELIPSEKIEISNIYKTSAVADGQNIFLLEGLHHASGLLSVSVDEGTTWLSADGQSYVWGTNGGTDGYFDGIIDENGQFSVRFLEGLAIGIPVWIKYVPRADRYRITTSLKQPNSSEDNYTEYCNSIRLLDHAVELMG